MTSIQKLLRQSRRGAALIISMIFVLVFSAMSLALYAMSGSNVQIASNQYKINRAYANAESGMQVMRFWLNRVLMPSSTATSVYFNTIINIVQSDLSNNNISNFTLSYDGSIPPVTLDSATGQTFSGQIQISANDPTILQAFVTGTCGGITRTIRVDYKITPYKHPIFNFGLATKGPLNFPGNPTIRGVNTNWEADIYVESTNDANAVFVGGNTNFDGDINIGSETADVDFKGDVLIAGEQGQTAIENHVFRVVDPPEFPIPDTAHFQQYATGDIIDSSTDTSKSMTITNAIVTAGTNPYFDGSVIIQGIMYIEPPNSVTFGRNVSLQGLIVAPGDVENPGNNSITFLGNFDTGPYPNDPQFDAIRDEIGSSIVAPGFTASFAGNFSTLDGVMAVSGVHFSGNVNALIKGTIISYSESPVVVEGNATMNFDRVNSTKIPAGFDTLRELDYDPNSYTLLY